MGDWAAFLPTREGRDVGYLKGQEQALSLIQISRLYVFQRLEFMLLSKDIR